MEDKVKDMLCLQICIPYHYFLFETGDSKTRKDFVHIREWWLEDLGLPKNAVWKYASAINLDELQGYTVDMITKKLELKSEGDDNDSGSDYATDKENHDTSVSSSKDDNSTAPANQDEPERLEGVTREEPIQQTNDQLANGLRLSQGAGYAGVENKENIEPINVNSLAEPHASIGLGIAPGVREREESFAIHEDEDTAEQNTIASGFAAGATSSRSSNAHVGPGVVGAAVRRRALPERRDTPGGMASPLELPDNINTPLSSLPTRASTLDASNRNKNINNNNVENSIPAKHVFIIWEDASAGDKNTSKVTNASSNTAISKYNSNQGKRLSNNNVIANTPPSAVLRKLLKKMNCNPDPVRPAVPATTCPTADDFQDAAEYFDEVITERKDMLASKRIRQQQQQQQQQRQQQRQQELHDDGPAGTNPLPNLNQNLKHGVETPELTAHLDTWDGSRGRYNWQTEGMFLCKLAEVVYKDDFEAGRRVHWTKQEKQQKELKVKQELEAMKKGKDKREEVLARLKRKRVVSAQEQEQERRPLPELPVSRLILPASRPPRPNNNH